VGTIISYTGTYPPNGWLKADGSSVLRSSYPALFALIGTSFGAGSVPGTTFALPDYRGTTGIFIIRATDDSVALTTSSSLIAVPVGSLQLFAMTSVPTGWVRADGQALSRTTYADLFASIGTTYGSGDGSTTFNVPNISGSGAGSPLYYIKAILSGDVQASTIAHASSHIRGGSDIIDADRVQIDYVPNFYTRDSSPAVAGATTDLSAHLSGVNNALGIGRVVNAYNTTSGTVTVNSTTWTTICSQTFTTTKTNSRIFVNWTGDMNADTAGAWNRIGIFIDGTIQYYIISSIADAAYQDSCAITGMYTIATQGSHTVTIQAQQGAGTVRYAEESGNHKTNLVVLELL
jgi:microcystin-dependent protein